MYEANDLTAHTESKLIDYEQWHRVIIHEGGTNPVWMSDRLYKDESEAHELATAINTAIFAAQCPVDGYPANYIDHFGNLDRDPTDIQAEPCSDACRRDLADENYALMGTGL